MSKVTIVTDSTAYLPKNLVEQYGIQVLPLTLHWKDNNYRDGVDITATEFYTRLSNSSSMVLPTTSAVSMGVYQQLFEKLLAEGRQLLVLPISSGLSSSVLSAFQAQKAFPGAPIEVIDTKLVSMALSFQVLAAARAAEKGASLAECKQVAENAYKHIGVYFTVETLKYLHAGGRIGSAKRLLGTALNIKPILEIRDGRIELVESVITRKKALNRLLELVGNGIDGRTPVHISVFHALTLETAEDLTERAQKMFNPIENIISEVSPVIGSHVGPGTVSIAYMAGE
ncbi:MAG: DegV family protein [Anaerolineaceae bacterium]